ncbi:replicative DNA helicase [Ruminococcus sp. YE71]|uniref:replicative DNA helicase n=1 Tax=unclassified Ruminococcus TaxID=2608920 RepID=UPI0008908476|nr:MULTISPECIES: replicative DNA helicase [unclassified Ruminococcus]SDA16945.1 replicative DNA helicase [Ruminococcus sp. YE78]SFW25838.1 replicative DNA helicase [Ruminococcus sp. YE71]
MADNRFDQLSQMALEKPVFSAYAEQTIIGSMLLDADAFSIVSMHLKSDSFYNQINAGLFQLLLEMSDGTVPDIVKVVENSVHKGIFKDAETAKSYLMNIRNEMPTTAKGVGNLEDYCRIVEEKYQMRLLIDAAKSILEKATDSTTEASEILDQAEQSIYDIRKGEVQGLTRIDNVIISAFDHLQEITGDEAEKHQSLKTGFSQLDKVTNGLNNSDLIILAARPAMGKSAFALNIAVNMCKRSMKDVAIFSLEMGSEQLVTRMLASEALVNNNNLRSGELTREDWEKLVAATDQLARLPIYMDDKASGITVPQMKAKLRRLKNLGLVVIDYLQLMESPNHHSSRVNEVSEITRQLKLMAKELNVPVIALSQLSRNSEKRDDKRPMLSDLRESGSIEQDADIIMFLYREAYYDENTENRTITECNVAKNRHGKTEVVKLSFIGEYTLFRGLDMRRDEQ